MMKRIISYLFFLALSVHFGFAQELVKSLQPAMYVNFKAGYQVSDSIVRYFFTSSDSKYASHHLTYSIDHNLLTKSLVARAVLDSTQQFSGLTAAYDLFHLGLPDGSSILGSNGFECDITITDLARIAADGSTMWSINWGEIFFNEFITSIGLIERDIIVVNGESNTPFYFDLNGQQEFFGTEPPGYFNIASTGNYYYGTNGASIFKLNDDFEIIDSYSGDTIRFFQKADHDLFLVGTDGGIALMDTALNAVASTAAIMNIISGVKSGAQIWVIDHEGLHQLDINLNVLKTYLPEPREVMKYVSASEDTVFVASEYDGFYHRDFVLRKYLPDDSLFSLPADLAISNVHLPEKIIREPLEGYPYIFNLRFDSLGIEITNSGEDTIHSCIINCDWKRSYDPGFFCSFYTNDWSIDSLSLVPGVSKVLQLGTFIPGSFYYGIIPTFCFWVDFPDEQPDINPGNDLLCMEGEIINHTSHVEDPHKIIVFPNPANDHLTIQNESGGRINKFFIYSINGDLIEKFSSYSDPVSLSIGDLVPGIYILMIPTEGGVEYHRFIRQ